MFHVKRRDGRVASRAARCVRIREIAGLSVLKARGAQLTPESLRDVSRETPLRKTGPSSSNKMVSRRGGSFP